MVIQTINIGNIVNDGLGDDLRTAFQKVNDNFSEAFSRLTVTASNAAGSVGQGIFAQKIDSDLQFKNLIAGNKIQLTGFADSIRIDFTNADAFTKITTDLGVINGSAHEQISILGSSNINVTAEGPTILVDTAVDAKSMLLGYNFGVINGPIDDTIQMLLLLANIDFGTILDPGLFSLDANNA